MAWWKDRPNSILYDKFEVTLVSPGTFLGAIVGADVIRVPARTRTEVHRHNRCDNVIFVVLGEAIALVDEGRVTIQAGERLFIGRGVFHGFETGERDLQFVSLQIPPALDEGGTFDCEVQGESAKDSDD